MVHGEELYTAIMFSGSGTSGLEATICSAIGNDESLLVVENGAYGTRLREIAETYNINVIQYKIPYGDYPNIDDIEKLLKQNDSVTHIALVHHETTTGMLNPVKDITKLAQSYHCETVVDVMSSYAGIPINIKEWNASYIISSSNKCIQGMPGIAFVICRKDKIDDLKKRRRSYSLDLYSQYTYFEKNKQTQFTPPVQITYALKQALHEYFQETEEKRYERYTGNWEILYDGLRNLGFKLLLPKEQESRILLAICEPTHSNYSFEKMHDYLYEKGFTIYPGKGAKEATFRLAVIGDINKEDISNFLVELKKYLKKSEIESLY